MQVKINTTTYHVWWSYDRSMETTTCHARIDGVSVAFDTHATVARYYKDPDNRNKARKYSLAKLLRILFPHAHETRRLFWRAYHDQLGHW